MQGKNYDVNFYYSKLKYDDINKQCPHCGSNISNNKNNSDFSSKCPYCGTVLDESDNIYRLEGVMHWENIYFIDDMKKIGKKLLIPSIILSIYLIAMMFISPTSVVFQSALILFLYLILTTIFLLINIENVYTPDFSKFKNYIKSINPNFDPIKLYMNIKNKVMSIHFSINFSKYQNIVDSELIIIETLNYFEDDKYQNISLKIRLKNFNLINNEKIENSYEDIFIKARKSLDNKDNFVSESKKFNCKNCGAKIDKLSNGICKYCNTKIITSDYDWEIIEYSSKNINNLK